MGVELGPAPLTDQLRDGREQVFSEIRFEGRHSRFSLLPQARRCLRSLLQVRQPAKPVPKGSFPGFAAAPRPFTTPFASPTEQRPCHGGGGKKASLAVTFLEKKRSREGNPTARSGWVGYDPPGFPAAGGSGNGYWSFALNRGSPRGSPTGVNFPRGMGRGAQAGTGGFTGGVPPGPRAPRGEQAAPHRPGSGQYRVTPRPSQLPPLYPQNPRVPLPAPTGLTHRGSRRTGTCSAPPPAPLPGRRATPPPLPRLPRDHALPRKVTSEDDVGGGFARMRAGGGDAVQLR